MLVIIMFDVKIW